MNDAERLLIPKELVNYSHYEKQKVYRKPFIAYTFDSYFDFIDAHKKHPAKEGSMLHSTSQPKFYGSKNLQEALGYAENGWKIGLDDFNARVEKIENKLFDDIYEDDYIYDVTGEVLDIGKHVSGEPECWLTKEEIRPKKSLDIYVNISVSCGISSDTINNRGAAITALVDLLSKHYALDLYAVISSYCPYHDGYYTSTRVKIPTAPLDLDMVAFMFAHPAASRRFGYAICDIHEGSNNVGNWRPADDQYLQKSDSKDVIYFEYARRNESYWNNEKNAADWVANFYLNKYLEGGK